MDEVTWRTTNYQRTSMLEHLRGKADARKLRLFGCACLRRLWSILSPDYRLTVERAERVAQEPYPVGFLLPEGVNRLLSHGMEEMIGRPVILARAAASLLHDPRHTSTYVLRVQQHADWQTGDWQEELAAQCDLIRCIFGNPFRPVELPSSCREAMAVRQISQVIDTEGRWSDMPILADALEDTGCVDEAILTHCRGSGPHGRGCWVVDMILGRGP